MENRYDVKEFNSIVQNRRSIYPKQFIKNKTIPDKIIWEILENANRAPTHKLTEPWRFTVFAAKGRERFAQLQTEIYTKHAGENFNEKKLVNLQNYPILSSHVIVIGMKRNVDKNIPEIEEIIATSCAIENIFLSLTAYGLGGYLSTGGITYFEEAKPHFNLGPHDKIIGTFFIGYPEETTNALTRRSPLQEKVRWIAD
ncbi:MAG TPA: nitroreductase [Hanamia sp.]|nr:nitroreductase [Hanamia sp.]